MMLVSFIDYTKLDPVLPDVVSGSERKNYAMPGKTCDRLIVKGASLNYNVVSIDGAEQARELLEAMKDGILDRTLADIAFCHGLCLNGPFMHGKDSNMFLSLQKLKKHVDMRQKLMGGEEKRRGDKLVRSKIRDKFRSYGNKEKRLYRRGDKRSPC